MDPRGTPTAASATAATGDTRETAAFRCFRMHIEYPPSYTRAVVRWLLPEKPTA